MPSLSYKKQFVEKILSGEKIHTIRSMRNRPFRVDDNLFHFSGLRTKQCKRLMKNKCIYAHIIQIRKIIKSLYEDIKIIIIPSGNFLTGNFFQLDINKRKLLAKNDGFDSYEEFKEFFVDRLPFYGQLIGWTAYPY